jgi:hypothetical protein
LSGSRCRDREAARNSDKTKNNFTHLSSPFERLMRMLCANSLALGLNALVIGRSNKLIR